MKKFLSLVLALIMVMSLVTVGAGAAFTDAEDIQYAEAVEVMSTLGILSGYNGAFDPQGTLSRQAAAKIIAYIALGVDDAEDLTFIESPFTDVAADATLAPYIAWAAKEGIINGTDAAGTKFEPKGNVSGHAYTKMILGALGIKGEYTGDNWRYNVTMAAQEAGLFEGIDTNIISLRDDITRELACQIAFNAMFYSETETSILYRVWDDADSDDVIDSNEDVYYEGTDAMTAAIAKVGNASAKMLQVKVAADSLAYKNFDLTVTTPADGGKDTYGRPATVYAVDGDAEVYVTEAPVLTIQGAATEKELFTALGKAGYQGTANKFVVIKEMYVDAVKAFSAVADKDNVTNTYAVTATVANGYDQTAANNYATVRKDDTSAWACGNGAVTEIYATAKANEFVAVTTNEYFGKVGEPVKANEAKGTKRSIPVTVYGVDTLSFETEEFAKNDYVLVTLKNGKIDTIKKAEAITNVAVDKFTANENVTFGDKTYKYSQYAGAGSFGTIKTGYDFTATYTFYLDSQGNVIANGTYSAGTVKDYVYVTQIQVEKASDADLLSGATDNLAVAEIITIDGEKKIVDINIYTEGSGSSKKYYYEKPVNHDTVAKTEVATSAGNTAEDIEDWFAYVVNEDGTYTFKTIDDDYADVAGGSFTMVKGSVTTLAGSKNTGSKTVLTYIEDDGAVTTYTGLVGVTVDGSDNKVLYTYAKDSTVITAIYAVEQGAQTSSASTNYAYALKSGATTSDGVEWTFAIGGEEVTYVVKGTAGTVVAGDVYELTISSGKVTTAAPVNGDASDLDEAFVRKNLPVDVLDESYIVTSGSVRYFADDMGVYNVEDNTVVVDALEKDDKITVVMVQTEAGRYEIVVAYITDAK